MLLRKWREKERRSAHAQPSRALCVILWYDFSFYKPWATIKIFWAGEWYSWSLSNAGLNYMDFLLWQGLFPEPPHSSRVNCDQNEFFFWPHQAICEILVPWPGIKFTPSALKAGSLSHWTTRDLPDWDF